MKTEKMKDSIIQPSGKDTLFSRQAVFFLRIFLILRYTLFHSFPKKEFLKVY